MPAAVAASKTKRRRSERGQQRIQSLLAAAEQVFAETGLEGATTNAIAARAQASPGTLYQFFRNKQQMAEAIAKRYAAQVSELQQKVLSAEGHTSPEACIDSVLDAFFLFLQTAPAFGPLMVSSQVSRQVTRKMRVLDESAIVLITRMMQRFAPQVREAQLAFHAEVCLALFDGMIRLLQVADPKRRALAAAECRQVFKRYLLPILNRGATEA